MWAGGGWAEQWAGWGTCRERWNVGAGGYSGGTWGWEVEGKAGRGAVLGGGEEDVEGVWEGAWLD